MEKFINLLITLVLVAIGALAVNFGFDYLTKGSPGQAFLFVNLLLFIAISFGASLYFTIVEFRNVEA